MGSDHLIKPNVPVMSGAEEPLLTSERGHHGQPDAADRPDVERAFSGTGTAIDGSSDVTSDVTDDAGPATVVSATGGPGLRRALSREQQVARARDKLAAAKEMVRRRSERDKAMIRNLVDRTKEREASDRRRERREHEKRANAARYRFADAMLKVLAKLEPRQWPAEVRGVIDEASAEDRAAIYRIVERDRAKQ